MSNYSKLFDLTGRVAVVTGGAGLLGEEFCKILATAGAQVVVADIDANAAKDLSHTLSELHAKEKRSVNMEVEPAVISSWIDVTDLDAVQSTVDTTLNQFGRLDILVNSAAMDPKFDPQHSGGHTNAFEGYPKEAWNKA